MRDVCGLSQEKSCMYIICISEIYLWWSWWRFYVDGYAGGALRHIRGRVWESLGQSGRDCPYGSFDVRACALRGRCRADGPTPSPCDVFESPTSGFDLGCLYLMRLNEAIKQPLRRNRLVRISPPTLVDHGRCGGSASCPKCPA